jgi:hypothetical protein
MHFASLLLNSVTFEVMIKSVKIVANSFENDIIVKVRFKGRRAEVGGWRSEVRGLPASGGFGVQRTNL